jgi:transcriptional regulator with XRE-family HTH domain
LNSGEMVKKARTKKGWSQRKLAKEIGKSYGMIAQWESGITIPTLNFALPVANKLDISFDELSAKLNEEKLLNEKNKLEKAFDAIQPSDIDKLVARTKSANELFVANVNVVNESSETYELDKLRVIEVPILGQVPAGQLQEILPKMRNEADEFEFIPTEGIFNPDMLFGLHVVGESMIGKDIQDGDIIIIDTSNQRRLG